MSEVKFCRTGTFTEVSIKGTSTLLLPYEVKALAEGLLKVCRETIGYRVKIKDNNGTQYVKLDPNDDWLWDFCDEKPEPVNRGQAESLMALVRRYYEAHKGDFDMTDVKIVRVVR